MILGGVKFKSGNMCARASTPPFIQRGRIVDRLYKLKYDAPFIPFWILTKDKRHYLINRPQDLAFPPDRTGLLFVIWHGGKCTVLKFSQVSLLKPKKRPLSRHVRHWRTFFPLGREKISPDTARRLSEIRYQWNRTGLLAVGSPLRAKASRGAATT